MKAILSLIISSALVVSGYSQTRNVLVGTNNAVVQPTNFWSADASNARTGLGLGTAATNPASAFQPSSLALSNLASNNGGALTNLQATNLVGLIPTSNIPSILLTNIGTITIAQGGTGATNAANARQNLGSTTVGDAVFIATNAAAARTTIGATTVGSSVFTLANPSAITFLRLNADNTVSALSASDFRTALSLNTAATNPSSAFQPSSSALTNLSTNNGVNLTNIPLAGVVGALATNGSAAELTNFPASLLTTNGNGAGLTNLTAANITGTVGLASNVTGTIAISNGGTGATSIGGARTNLGLGQSQTVTFESLIIGSQGSGVNATNLSFIFEHTGTPRFEIGESNIVLLSSNGALSFGTNNTTGANITRNNLGVGTNQNPTFSNVTISSFSGTTGLVSSGVGKNLILVATNVLTANAAFYGWDGFQITAFSAAQARTNLGLSFAALTNTNTSGFNASLYGSGTNPVLVNTNGEVVSPTNFWQVSPANTRVQISQPVANATNTATNARNLFLYSLAISTTGVTNTIQLPTNGGTLLGDVATVIHEGPTSSITAVRQAGAGSNLVTLNQFQEAVKFIYESAGWRLADNLSFVEAIYFSGTNAAANAAASRTNLGLGALNNVVFGSVDANLDAGGGSNAIVFNSAIEFDDIHTEDIVSVTRTNLGLPLAALTNTNNAKFQEAIFTTNSIPTNSANVNSVGFNTAVAWMEVSVITNGVTNSYRIPLFQ